LIFFTGLSPNDGCPVSRPRWRSDQRRRVSGTLGALVSTGLLTRQEAERWRALADEAGRSRTPIQPSKRRLIAPWSSYSNRSTRRWKADPAYERFDGALRALSDIGAVGPALWDRRCGSARVFELRTGARRDAQPKRRRHRAGARRRHRRPEEPTKECGPLRAALHRRTKPDAVARQR